MSKEQTAISTEVHDVLAARWQGFRRLAKTLPNHHILAVELIRTLNDETIAVFTTVRNGEPVRSVVRGDAHGRVRSLDWHHAAAVSHHAPVHPEPKVVSSGDAVDPAIVALGHPPPEEPVTPGVVAIGGSLLGAAFDVGEFVDTSAK